MANDSTEAARELLHVVMLVMRSVSAELRRSATPMAPAQLGTLMKIANEPCRVSDLARHLAVSLPTMSKSVDMLVRRRLVERYADETDRRQTMIRPTAAGRRAALRMKARAERHVARALAPLGASDRTALLSALGPVKRALAPPQ